MRLPPDFGGPGPRRGTSEHAHRSAANHDEGLRNCRDQSWITSEHLLRDLAPQVLGAVIRRFRDFAAAEDAVQEALIAAALQWPSEGLPDNPRGWLIQVAFRRMTDHVRSELARRRRETAVAMEMDRLAPVADRE